MRDERVRNAVDALAEPRPDVVHGVASVDGLGVAEAHGDVVGEVGVKRSGSIESMSSNSCDRSAIGLVYTRAMLDPSMIRGTHHLTFCVGGAQEDYDFHVRLLGLRSVKKTVLFDGEIPIYHLYYANRIGDLSTILTSFPYRQAGWMGRRGTNQLRTISVAVPADSVGYWADRLRAAGIEVEEVERFGTQRLDFAHPCGIPYTVVGETEGDDREPWDGSEVPLEHAIRGAYGTTTSVREPGPMDEFLRRGLGADHVARRGRTTSTGSASTGAGAA